MCVNTYVHTVLGVS